jgi:formylglycine-generating enzyme required for sulfatase activity
MGRTEVTQGQWQAVMGNNPSGFKGQDLPVEQVSWLNAQEFIRKLNQLNDGYVYRLPTEAEWEYACRAGSTGDYAGDLDSMAWYDKNSDNQTHVVGTKQPNAFGLYDMHGNVSEWCEDYYHDRYTGAPSDGSAWLSGGEMKYRVLRGGSWYNGATNARSANRFKYGPDFRFNYVGFRVVAAVRTS